MRPIIIGFGLLILCLLVLFRIGEVNFIKDKVKLEVIVAIAALIFFFVGLYFNYHSQKKFIQTQAPSTGSPEISSPAIDNGQKIMGGISSQLWKKIDTKWVITAEHAG